MFHVEHERKPPMDISDEYRESIRIRLELISAHMNNPAVHVRALQRANLHVIRALADIKTDLEHPEWDGDERAIHE